jgi:hypothetical protein
MNEDCGVFSFFWFKNILFCIKNQPPPSGLPNPWPDDPSFQSQEGKIRSRDFKLVSKYLYYKICNKHEFLLLTNFLPLGQESLSRKLGKYPGLPGGGGAFFL